MPKRKAPTRISGLTGSDDEDIMQLAGNDSAPPQEPRDEPAAKKRRGRPRTSNDDAPESKPTAQDKKRESSTAAQPAPTATQRGTRRGRPRGDSRTSESGETKARAGTTTQEQQDEEAYNQENEDPLAHTESKTTSATKAAKPAPVRRRGRAPSVAKQVVTDGEFEYTPKGSRQDHAQKQSLAEPEASPRPRAAQRRNAAQTGDSANDEPTADVVDESILAEEASSTHYVPSSAVKNARARLSSMRNTQDLSRKRKSNDGEQSADPELRRRIGDITKKHDALESKYRNLREIGIVEANSNMDKLRKQCETVSTASNDLVVALRSELEAQKTLGQQSRGLQKQLKDKDAEIARLRTEADEARSQMAATQTEVKALQTKLAAARNTAASLENTVKVPGSAMKGGPANRAVAAEAAQAAQMAQLKEDLYSDLTGLIIRDVKAREADHLYDCIQTGVNGTLHFKLAIPKVSSAEYEKAVFEYLPLLDANRDRELVDILPDFLIDHITFERDQAPKFYTRVIDALMKRRNSTAHRS
ncbi:hypothetical protein N7478_008642 [Penicillium angulare]|uniref:uncharacterized protein n=1 Tax=Penicillium angulare TaxID=116970 RepID=UPI0025416FAE|nr:uncharacterized protein N7478_008642 [Penicillium angulare]KAJ5273517.1 hypothetical protein N7478_008642 [Penicillium angulare]